MANKVVIDIEARLIDKVSSGASSFSKKLDEMGKKADQAKKKLDQLNKTKAQPKIGAEDSKFTKAMSRTQRLLKRLGGTKATAIIDAMDRATSKIQAVHSKAKAFESHYMARLGINAGDSLGTINTITNGLRNIGGKTWRGTLKILDAATMPVRKITSALFNLKTVFMGVVGAMATKKLLMEPIDLADQYTGAKIGFSTLLGESAGQEMMNKIDQFAKATPFKTSGVIANVQKMLAMGWNAETIIDDMKTIGDAAAATGKGEEGLGRIVLALSQIRSKGKLSTEELNQMAEAGISAKRYLAEGLGYGSGDEGIMKLSKDLEKGTIGAEAAIQAIMQGMQEYKGMMESTANETVVGLKSQLEDTFEINVARRWGQGLQDAAKRGLGSVVTLLDEADGALVEFGDTVYDLGKAVGDFAADKMENAIKRITEITGTFEFKNANLGEKMSMLWKGVVADPLKDWWENGGRDKTAASAQRIGKGIGEFLSMSIKGVLGMTDVFKEGGIDASEGTSIAKGFAQGFVEGFDVSGITDKLIEAISNVWNALPMWGKLLVGGYAGGKALSGIASIAGGLSTIAPLATVASGGMAKLGQWAMGGGAGLAGVSGTVAATAGAGLLATGVGMVHASNSAIDAYKAFKSGDKSEGWANTAKAGGTIGGALIGAKAGAMLGSAVGPAGTLVGAGIGTAVGWFAGDKIAQNIRAAKAESEGLKKALKDSDASAEKIAKEFEKEVWKNQKEHFGNMKLSMDEIARLSQQIVYGNKLDKFDKFASSAKQAQASYESMASAAEKIDRFQWKARMGVKFSKDEIKGITESLEEYISGAKAYVENKHYEFTAAVELLVDTKSAKGILKSGNAYYSKMTEDLDKAGKELGKAMSKALKDGIIDAKEQEVVSAAQQKIASITNKIAEARTASEMELIKIKFGGDTIDSESFANMQAQIQKSIDERMKSSDEAFTTTLSSLKLQLQDGAIDEEEYNKHLQTLMDGYKGTVSKLRAEVQDVQLDIVADAYENVLGPDAKTKLETALDTAFKEGVNPKEWTTDEVRKILGVDSLTEGSAGAIQEYLSNIYGQLQLLEVDGNLYIKMKPKTNAPEASAKVKSEAETAIESQLANPLQEELGVNITGKKQIQNKISVTKEDFGISDVISGTVNIFLKAKKKVEKFLPWHDFRGGMVGASGQVPGFSNGGYVRGGGQLVKVAEEGDPEVIIPLSPRRRDRAQRLWRETGKLIHADFGGNYATGGIAGGDTTISSAPKLSGASGAIKIDVGGVEVHVHVGDGQGVLESIQDQKEALAEEIAGIIEKAIATQYSNMPSKKGA